MQSAGVVVGLDRAFRAAHADGQHRGVDVVAGIRLELGDGEPQPAGEQVQARGQHALVRAEPVFRDREPAIGAELQDRAVLHVNLGRGVGPGLDDVLLLDLHALLGGHVRVGAQKLHRAGGLGDDADAGERRRTGAAGQQQQKEQVSSHRRLRSRKSDLTIDQINALTNHAFTFGRCCISSR